MSNLNTLFKSISKNSSPVYKDIKQSIEKMGSTVRTTLIEQLGKRMNKQDADILQKYMGTISQPEPTKIPTVTPSINENKQTTQPTSLTNNSIETHKSTKLQLDMDQQQDISLLHPIFGQLIINLNYKSVYITNVRRLALCPVWKKQRTLRHDRAGRIIEFKIKAGTITKLPGVITMYHNIKSGEIGIVDGQVSTFQ